MKVIVKVEGGPLDGEIQGDDHDMSSEIASFYHLTNEGTIGQSIIMASPKAMEMVQELAKQGKRGKELVTGLRPSKYQIVDRSEIAGAVFLTARFMGHV